MSLLKKLSERLARAGESGELKKIRDEAEKRQAAKSSGLLKKVKTDVVDKTIDSLAQRVNDSEDKSKK